MSESPVQIDVESPVHFDRVQLLLRIGIALLIGWVGVTAGWLACLLFAALPLIAAITLSSNENEYFEKVAPKLWAVMDWLLRFSAYMLLLVDRLPTRETASVLTEISYTGQPTAGSALSRLVTSIPSGVVLMVLWCVSGASWVIAALAVLIGLPMPRSILAFQRGVLRWQARLLAYHASLVVEYPPWSFDAGTVLGEPLVVAGGRLRLREPVAITGVP